MKLLRESTNPQAQFLWAILRDTFHYIAVHLDAIADNARDIDFAMRWGFGMKQGPFELWQAAGWQQVADWVKEDIDAGKALCQRAAAGLGVRRPATAACTRAEGSWSAGAQGLRAALDAAGLPAPALPRDACSARAPPTPLNGRHRGVRERRGAHLDAGRRGADRQHHHQAAPDQPGRDRRPGEGASSWPKPSYKGLVIWSPDDAFSAGADLEAMLPVFMKGGAKAIAPEVKKLQDAHAAHELRQRAGGGGGARPGAGRRLRAGAALRAGAWRAMESYIGLVEVGVGLIPAGGGLKDIARRAAEMAARGNAQRRPAAVPEGRLHQRRDGQGRAPARWRRASWAICCATT